ncbi:MAG: hypothetical protein GY862_39195 [Gammaproteobacteria bacterium]|nr:hypothetical protein [Gammaproteobacteria bacterium]
MEKKTEARKAYLEKVEAALRRAALRARETARRTGTPLIIYKDGQIVKIKIGEKDEQTLYTSHG